jgi:hypothetical protein
MELHEIHLPSVADYVAAFEAIEARITPKQRELLLVHHRAQARVTSATRLAEAVGFENYNAVNLQYGLLARQIADQLGIELNESVVAGVLVDFVDPGFVAQRTLPLGAATQRGSGAGRLGLGATGFSSPIPRARSKRSLRSTRSGLNVRRHDVTWPAVDSLQPSRSAVRSRAHSQAC